MLWIRALMLTLAATGCATSTAVEYAYNRADWFVMKEVDTRLCPSPERRKAFEGEVGKLLKWHRAEELPRYAALLRQVADAVGDGVTRPEFDAVVDQIEARAWATLRRVGPTLAELLAGRESPELECFEGEAQKTHEELMERVEQTDDERLDARLEVWERLTGDLDDAQRRLLKARWGLTADHARAEAERRHRGTQRLLTVLELPAGERGKALLDALTAPEGLYHGDDVKIIQAERLRGVERAWEFLQILTPAQRETLARNARSLAATFDKLSKQR